MVFQVGVVLTLIMFDLSGAALYVPLYAMVAITIGSASDRAARAAPARAGPRRRATRRRTRQHSAKVLPDAYACGSLRADMDSL